MPRLAVIFNFIFVYVTHACHWHQPTMFFVQTTTGSRRSARRTPLHREQLDAASTARRETRRALASLSSCSSLTVSLSSLLAVVRVAAVGAAAGVGARSVPCGVARSSWKGAQWNHWYIAERQVCFSTFLSHLILTFYIVSPDDDALKCFVHVLDDSIYCHRVNTLDSYASANNDVCFFVFYYLLFKLILFLKKRLLIIANLRDSLH